MHWIQRARVAAVMVAGLGVVPGVALGDPSVGDLGDVDIARYERALAWVAGFEIDQPSRAAFDGAIREDWRTSTPEERQAFRPNLEAIEKLMGEEPRAREVMRLNYRKELIAEARKKNAEPLGRYLLGAIAAAHPPLAKGDPPLTRNVVEAMVRMMAFMMADLRGLPEPSVPSDVVDNAAKVLAQRWPELSVARRQAFLDSPLQFAALRYRWPALSDAAKEPTRAAWRRSVGEPAEAATPGPTAVSENEAAANPDESEETEAKPTARKQAAKKASTVKRPKSKRTPEQERESNAMIDTMQAQMHQMNMEIIRNIGRSMLPAGTSYRY